MTGAEKFSQFADTYAVRQNLKQKSVRGVFFMVGTGGVDFVIRLGSTFLLARLLSPTDFGLVAMVLSSRWNGCLAFFQSRTRGRCLHGSAFFAASRTKRNNGPSFG